MKIKWLGTAGFELTFEDNVVLIDPFISRLEGAIPNIPKSDFRFDKVDHIYLTHGHFDHAIDAPEIVAQTGAQLFCSKALLPKFAKLGVPESKMTPLSGKERFNFSDYSVEVIKSVHAKFGMNVILSKFLSPKVLRRMGWLIRMGRNYPKGEVMGFFVVSKRDSLNIAAFGSGGWIEDEISRYKGRTDLFLAPYAGRYDMEKVITEMTSHLDPKILIPHHWDDSFPPLSWKLSIDNLKGELERVNAQVNVFVPDINDEFEITNIEEFTAQHIRE